MSNEDLHPILKKIHQTIGTVVKEIQKLHGEAVKIREAVVQGLPRITEAIDENTKARAELTLMERMVEVESILPQIEAEKDRVDIEREELDRQLARVSDRYDEKHAELDQKAANRIRDVGSHIFEIDEQEFEEGIETPFVDHVTPVWQSLQSQNDTFSQQRCEVVESTTGEVVTDIHNFVDQQHELVDRIQQVRTEFSHAVSEPTTMQVPYYVVTVETDGEVEQHVVTPSETEQGDGYCSVSLQPLEGIDTIITPTEIDRSQSDTLTSSSIREQLDPHIEEDIPLVSYGTAVEKAVDDEVAVTIEGES